jgi:hypothetical protein
MSSNRRSIVALFAGAAVTFAAGAARAEPPAAQELGAAYALKSEGRWDEAARAFAKARAAGASDQLVSLELGYLAAARGDTDAARRHFIEASRGGDAELTRRARAELDALAPPAAPPPPPRAEAPRPPSAASALDEAYRAKAAGDAAGAAAAFRRARAAGANPQLVSMELGYLAAQGGNPDEAQARFREAERGPDADMGAQARRELGVLPKHLYADVYADAFGWDRVAGPSNGSSVVPVVRVRGFYRPVLSVPVDLYVSGQATRDTASHGFVGTALPKIYADNYATFGGGARARLFGKRVDLFAQAGPAFDLLDDGRDRVVLDVRGGAIGYVETAACAPAPERRAKAAFWPCLEAYAEATYVSRFHDNVMGFARPRAAAGYLMTGPVLWQAALEARAAKDLNKDYWNNFADAGAGHRWRLLAPFRFDLRLTVNAGAYYGLAGRDPAPSKLGYVDARGLATTYVEF